VSRSNDAVRQTNPVQSSVCKRLKEIRKGLFGVHGGPELARQLGVSASAWAGYEVGGNMPDAVAKAFLAVTGCSPIWLLTGEGPQFQNELPTGTCTKRLTYTGPVSFPVFGGEDSSKAQKTVSADLKTEIARLRAKIAEVINRAQAQNAQTRKALEAARASASIRRHKALMNQSKGETQAAAPGAAQSHKGLAEIEVRVARIDPGQTRPISLSDTKTNRRRRRRKTVTQR
jgi:hypothetical protein